MKKESFRQPLRYLSVALLCCFAVGIGIQLGANPESASAVQNAQNGKAAHQRLALDRLNRLDPTSTVVVQPSGLLGVNDEVDVSPVKLNSMGNDELKDLLEVTKALRAVGSDSGKLNNAMRQKYVELTRKRLRGKAHFRHADEFLRSMNLDAHPLFTRTQPTAWDRGRLFDLAVEPVMFRGKKEQDGTAIKRRLAGYAIYTKPASIGEFIARFQFARAHYIRKIEEVGAANARAALFAFNFFADVNQALASKRAQLDPARHLGKPKIAIPAGGLGQKNGGQTPLFQTSDHVIVGKLRSLRRPSFSDAEALLYHVHKHHNEMPSSHRAPKGGNEVEAFLASAWGTVATPASDWSATVNPDGQSKQFVFQRSILQDGKSYKSTVFLKVAEDGGVTISTYIPDLTVPLTNLYPGSVVVAPPVTKPVPPRNVRPAPPRTVRPAPRPVKPRRTPPRIGAPRTNKPVPPRAKPPRLRRPIPRPAPRLVPRPVQPRVTPHPKLRVISKSRRRGRPTNVRIAVNVQSKLLVKAHRKGAPRRRGQRNRKPWSRALIVGRQLHKGQQNVQLRLRPGVYRIEFFARDKAGRTTRTHFRLVVK